MANLLYRTCGLELDLPFGVLDDLPAPRRGTCVYLLAQRFGIGTAPRDDGLRLDAGLARSSAPIPSAAARAPAWPAVASSSALAIAPAGARAPQQRPPRKLREQPHQHEERQDRPDEQPGIGSGPSGLSIDLPSEERSAGEHFRENRDAFEQEERQVDRAGDLRRRARLTARCLRPRPPPACRCPDPRRSRPSPRPSAGAHVTQLH